MNERSIVLVLLFGAACGGNAQHSKIPLAVRVQTVEASANGQGGARYSAQISPDSRVDLAFKVGGYIDEVAKVKGPDGKLRTLQDGDWVQKGDVLARVRASDYVQQVNEARAGLTEAQAAREQARLDFERARGLFENQGISRAELDGARARADAAKARADGIAARLVAAQTALADTALRSPMDGMVMKRMVEVGTLVGPGAPGFSVADTRAVKAVFGVPDTLVEALKLGSVQTVTSEALRGAALVGKISRISPSADLRTRTFEVETTIDNPKQELKAGMVVSLKLADEAAPAGESSILLPLTSIVMQPNKEEAFAVFVVENKDQKVFAHRRDVELGEFLGNSIPVKSGLKTGEQVIVQGASLVADGEEVGIIK